VNGVGLFFHTDDHRFAFTTQATDKMDGRVNFELLKVCDCVHVYINLMAKNAHRKRTAVRFHRVAACRPLRRFTTMLNPMQILVSAPWQDGAHQISLPTSLIARQHRPVRVHTLAG